MITSNYFDMALVVFYLGTGLDRTLLISPDPDAMNCVDITIFEDQIIEAVQLLTLTLQEDNVPVLFEGTATFRVDDNDRMFAVVIVIVVTATITP